MIFYSSFYRGIIVISYWQSLRRRVVAAGGSASDYMRPDADVAVVRDGRGWDGDMEEAAGENPSLRCVLRLTG